jgi:predicted DsbA family dithiol-disulfide isomerase
VRIEKLKEAYDVDVQTVHFPLHADTPMEGLSLEELFAGRDMDMDAMYARMKGMMDAEGLPYAKRTHTYNSRLAQELGKWADTQLGGEAIHMKLYQAYFVDQQNIADIELLVSIAEAAGLDGSAAREVLETRSFKDAIDADWAKSQGYGVTGVPTYVAEGQGVVGAQPYEVLEQFMDAVGAAKAGA